jgi:hypothetical protein
VLGNQSSGYDAYDFYENEFHFGWNLEIWINEFSIDNASSICYISYQMNSMLNRTLGKKVVRDSRFLYCVWFSHRCKHYGHLWFWEGSTPLGTAATWSFAIFQKKLEMYHFGKSYFVIWLTALGESMLVGKVI